ncbi:hypothetical protein AAIH51_15045 [Pseudomonas aeruginosa]|uniref:hypothetical protein n=1 Tax=Pseudomonas aeruginosa TaxID=287 RepID=UPI0031B722F0
MAIHINDKLQKILNNLNADSRLSTWLWFFIRYYSPQTHLGEFRSPGMRDKMADFIISHPELRQTIEIRKNNDFLPEQSLHWITNDKRQNAFLIKKLAEKNGYNYITEPTNLTGRELTIATIDIWPIDLAQKSLLVNQTKTEWEQHSSTDHIFKWLDGPDVNQKLETAWGMFKSKFPLLTSQPNPPQEKDDLIILFDSPFITVPEKILLMDSIRKRWSQNKYRSKQSGKKQYNFILSDKAINRLDKLADKHDLKRTQVLEILLQMEEEKGAYIPEKLRPLLDI